MRNASWGILERKAILQHGKINSCINLKKNVSVLCARSSYFLAQISSIFTKKKTTLLFSLTVVRAAIWPTSVASVRNYPFIHTFIKQRTTDSPITWAYSAEPAFSSTSTSGPSLGTLFSVGLHHTEFISTWLMHLRTVAFCPSQDPHNSGQWQASFWEEGHYEERKNKTYGDTLPADLGSPQLLV